MAFILNDIEYRLPKRPVVVICLDGCGSGYLEAALEAGGLPNIKRIIDKGFYHKAKSLIPSFTNPNNIGIITGATPDVHGISGNYFLNPRTHQEVMMNSPEFLLSPTLLEVFHQNGLKVAAITAKDKLRLMLQRGWQGICFSAEKASQANLEENGIEDVPRMMGRKEPDIYSGLLSQYALEAAWRIMSGQGPYLPDVLYVTTTDYVPHRYGPDTEEAMRFLADLDDIISKLAELDLVLAITADHGMNDKYRPDGSPNAIWLSLELEKQGLKESKIILPITDPYLAHHGALGSFASIYTSLPAGRHGQRDKALAHLNELKGVDEALVRNEAAEKYCLPRERIGDVIVLGDKHTVFGTRPEEHSQAPKYLRSHGGLAESEVFIILNRPLSKDYEERAKRHRRGEPPGSPDITGGGGTPPLQNIEVFDLVMNALQ